MPERSPSSRLASFLFSRALSDALLICLDNVETCSYSSASGATPTVCVDLLCASDSRNEINLHIRDVSPLFDDSANFHSQFLNECETEAFCLGREGIRNAVSVLLEFYPVSAGASINNLREPLLDEGSTERDIRQLKRVLDIESRRTIQDRVVDAIRVVRRRDCQDAAVCREPIELI